MMAVTVLPSYLFDNDDVHFSARAATSIDVCDVCLTAQVTAAYLIRATDRSVGTCDLWIVETLFAAIPQSQFLSIINQLKSLTELDP